MKLINKTNFFLICLLILSCTNSDSDDMSMSLKSYLEGKNIETGAVIACAASDKNTGAVLTFYYPETGALNIRYYETSTSEVEKDNYSNYTQVLLNSEPFFNGHLGKFTQVASNEKWIIVTFELDGVIKISNPIRAKQITKPTVWNDEVTINQSQSGMPIFSWEDNPVGYNAIYFQVVSDTENNLLSGTYTYENQFQYYNTDNVVLNVTTQTPPSLVLNADYNFTLMDVSEDNWVNWVVQKSFGTE